MRDLPVLLMPVGLPRAGKSTWARSTGVPVVNPDSIRLALHGQVFYAPAEPLVWGHAKLMVASLFLAGHKVVVLDATNVSTQRRAEWLSKEWTCRYVCFKTSLDVCLERAVRGGRADLVPVINRMAKALEFPDDFTGMEALAVLRTADEIQAVLDTAR